MKKILLTTLSLIVALQITSAQENTLKITSFKAFPVEVEADVIKTELVTTVNRLDATSRKYTIVEGKGSIIKMGKSDIVEFADNKQVRIQVIVADERYGCDTAYLKCRADGRKIDVSSTYYLNEAEWTKVVKKFSAPLVKRAQMAFAPNNPELPNVLIIGTSISMGYTAPVRKLLDGVANVYRIPENSNSTQNSLAKIDFWLGDMKWDVIHVNWGLHDLKYTLGDKQQDVPPAEYQANLRRLLQRLTDTGAKIVWASTSYVPEKCSPRRDIGDDKLYNDLALEVIKEFSNIIIDDQYTLTKENPQNQLKNNVHFTAAGYQQQAQQASVYIKEALATKSKKSKKSKK